MYILETIPSGRKVLWKVTDDGLFSSDLSPAYALWSWDELEEDSFSNINPNHKWDCLTEEEAMLEML